MSKEGSILGMSKTISKIMMWAMWCLAALQAFFLAHFLIGHTSRLNSFSKPFGVFAISMFLIPLLVGAGLRFWLTRIGNSWLALLPFFGGLFFALQAEFFGIFLFPEFCVVFQILCGVLFLVYVPVFVRSDRILPASEASHE